MPKAPSTLDFLDVAEEDLATIGRHNRDHAERILKKILQWKDHIQWGWVPQEHLTYLSGSGSAYNFYRERVGNAGYRVIYEISEDEMTVVAILPKGDQTYDLDEFQQRMQQT